ncbi:MULTISPECIES: hypothetical protein [Caballeronia]|jgi:hypothetical protein|uniref:DUF4239 domain-containing protein n=1 Tax=Caballeronia zhejiangensis TaxID=871203 RepID=A0A656QLQ3_9BURK|nr:MULTISPECIES: hypothetical protein [Caballeronia]EKS68315.1 hypothetical protein BURK_024835 [Burkholderia sp. SJ98]KDR31622.1 hypothetical protein BG60_29530 [Caballeronia zhejiangensis]MCG7402574.1 hypothetical protein [Caballeronia zhejiangensis]MCI1044301.1 hypothetical protein [Caballeronia zhejiangensis]MDR5764602.1 hypothetical protein [Caballeronia sp. LZ028]
MTEIQSAVLVFVLLLASTGIGAIVRPLLPEEHKAQETVQLVQLLVGMLVTFAALVLGLLTASAKTVFDTTNNDMRSYASSIIELDRTMRDYGAELGHARQLLRKYTAAAVASTWPSEPRPPGEYPAVEAPNKNDSLASSTLGAMLSEAQREVRLLVPRDDYHRQLAVEAAARFEQLIALRWKLIEEAHGSISYPFDRILVGWLLIIFLCFGLIAPRNALSLVTIMLGALSIASAVLVILDLDTPFTGPIMVGSQPMRDALSYESR